jgi:hypothetical protein
MTCIHCGAIVETAEEIGTDESVLAALLNVAASSTPPRPWLCGKCAAVLSPDPEPRAEFYCLWCRRPLGGDGKTPRRDASPLAAQSDECVIFRECLDCAKDRREGGAGRRLQPRPR